MITGAARKAEAMMNRKRVMPDAKERAKVFNSMVCKGKISSVVWYIIEREKEGVYYYQEIQIKMRGWNIGGTGKKNSEGRDIPVSRVC